MEPTNGKAQAEAAVNRKLWKIPTLLSEVNKAHPIGKKAMVALLKYNARNRNLHQEPSNSLQIWGFEGIRYIGDVTNKGLVIFARVAPVQVLHVNHHQIPQEFQNFISQNAER